MAKKYSLDADDYVRRALPEEILAAFYDSGWNAWGIYELCKEALSLDKKHKEKPTTD